MSDNRGKRRKTSPRLKKRLRLLTAELVVLVLLLLCYGGVTFVSGIWNQVERETEDPNLFYSSDETGYHTEAATFVVTDTDGSTEVYSIDLTEEPTNVLESKVVEKMSGYRTFVVMGVDARDQSTGKLTRYTQGDVCMIVSINLETKEVKIASVYRDTLIEGTEDYRAKLTDVYCYLGASRFTAVLNRNYDLEISDYVVINWKAVADVINLVGGLDVELSQREADAANGEIAPVMQATGLESTMLESRDGVQHMDGVQCVAYARIRKVGNNDYRRTERQRYIVNLLLEKAKHLKMSELIDIIETMAPEIATSFDLLEILDLAKDIFSYNITETTGFPFSYKTVRYIYPKDLTANVAELHRFLYGTEDYVPSANVRRLSGLYAELILEASE